MQNDVSPPVSSGCYRYLLDGKDTGIDERWQRQVSADGVVTTNSTRVAPGIKIAVRAQGTASQINAFDVEWTREGAATLLAAYSFDGRDVLVSRSCAEQGMEQAVEQQRVVSTQDVAPLLSPLMRIFAGPVIARLLADGGCGQVVLPFIGDPEARNQLLWPVLSERRAVRLPQADEILLVGSREIPARCCEYMGDQYADGTRFWLGSDDDLLRYCWQQPGVGEWDVRLEMDEG
ncbi:MAG: hypothetical protein V7746_13980 [Halioglobus sp.]